MTTAEFMELVEVTEGGHWLPKPGAFLAASVQGTTARREAWEMFVGPVPLGHTIQRRREGPRACHEERCCNPAHQRRPNRINSATFGTLDVEHPPPVVRTLRFITKNPAGVTLRQVTENLTSRRCASALNIRRVKSHGKRTLGWLKVLINRRYVVRDGSLYVATEKGREAIQAIDKPRASHVRSEDSGVGVGSDEAIPVPELEVRDVREEG